MKWLVLSKNKLIIIFLSLFLISGIFLFIYIKIQLTSLPQLDVMDKTLATIKITDRNDNLITQISSGNINRTPVSDDAITSVMKKATIAAEDKSFYEEGAYNFPRLIKSFYIDLQTRQFQEGGSTITQQLAKLAFLSSDKSISRKIRELELANQITVHYTKSEILTKYLNIVYFGHGAYGIENAATIYFGKHANQLNLQEATLLAGILQAPSANDPLINPQQAFSRQHYVINNLLSTNKISYQEASSIDPLFGGKRPDELQKYIRLENQNNINADLQNGKSIQFGGKAPHFVQYVQKQIRDFIALNPNLAYQSLVVKSTIDLSYQNVAVESVKTGVLQIGGGANNGALLMMDSHTGEILTMVGSADFNNVAIGGQFNVVTAERQPGSSFKPIVYEEAFKENKLTPYSILDDTKYESEKLQGVQNYDNAYFGKISVNEALIESRNIPAEQAMQITGITNVISFAQSLGITSKLSLNLSTAIGGSSVKMLDLTSAYAAFSNGGYRVSPISILKIQNENGEEVYNWSTTSTAKEQVMTKKQACEITNILKNYPDQWGIYFNMPTAGKSGTTNDFIDAWYMMYSPQFVVGTWVGHTDGENPKEVGMNNIYGTAVGRKITAPFVNAILASDPETTAALQKPFDCYIFNSYKNTIADLSMNDLAVQDVSLFESPMIKNKLKKNHKND